MNTVQVTVSLENLNATEIAALQRIVAKACVDPHRPDSLAAIVAAGLASAGDEYAEETGKVSEFFAG
jgi:hypothetical protein